MIRETLEDHSLADRLAMIGKDCAANLHEPYRSVIMGSCCTRRKGCRDDDCALAIIPFSAMGRKHGHVCVRRQS